MTSLPVFLLQRLDEDEAAAKAVPPSPWGDDFSVRFESWESDHSDEDSAFVDRFNPARVLADVEAKRRIVEEHSSREVASMDRETWGQSFTVCRRCCDPMNGRQIVAPCPTLRLLALPYADHEDYREEWKP